MEKMIVWLHPANDACRHCKDCSTYGDDEGSCASAGCRAVRRRAAADNLWAPPPPTFVDRRTAADNLRRCHFCCVDLQIYLFSGASIPSETMMHLPPCFRFPPYFRKNGIGGDCRRRC